MDVLRRDTDYALRAMVNLAGHGRDEAVSTKEIAHSGNISYQFACKILQRLHDAELVESCMGPKGGFRLGRDSSKINLLETIESIQGPISLNRCVHNERVCNRQITCPVSAKLTELQRQIEGFLGSVTLRELAQS